MFLGLFGLFSIVRLTAAQKQLSRSTSARIKKLSTDKFDNPNSNILLVLWSFHHYNTKKIADVIAETLGAEIKTPAEINPEDVQRYDLIGFGSGIYHQQHHRSLLDLADNLKEVSGKRTFIFSTSGVSREFAIKNSIDDPHEVLREKLLSKECIILGEFNCPGWNTNSFLKIAAGINKFRPNAKDLQDAKEFAEDLKESVKDLAIPFGTK